MAWFPSYARGLLNGGKLAKIKDFGDYLAYRKSYEWSQEKRKNKK
jgi:hypothetical protein